MAFSARQLPVSDECSTESGGWYPDRIVSPSATLQAIRPFLSSLGITRLGLMTGLDKLNIPVAFATRPNSYTLSIFQGKGLDKDSALVSAAMEALETRVAETEPTHFEMARLEEMCASGRAVLDFTATARCAPEEIPDAPLKWVQGLDLVSNTSAMVPWALVGLDHREPRALGFEQSSDGLASGNSYDEAVLHGLCELIERDAWTLAQLDRTTPLQDRVVDIESNDDAAFQILLRRIQASNLSLVLLDISTDVGVPAYFAFLVPSCASKYQAVSWSEVCGGCGCHPDPRRAAMKAVVEAAQSRLTMIAGSRDDLASEIYQPVEDRSNVHDLFELSKGRGKPIRAGNIGASSPHILVREMVASLRQIGISQIVVVPLEYGELPVSVVRVLVPGLEVGLHGSFLLLGTRAAQAVLGSE